MGFIIKNTSGLINTKLTDTARQKISQGKFNISFFQIGDSEVSYNTLPSSYNPSNSFVLEPSFTAQNSAGVPQSNKENIKYPYYVDGSTGNTYGIPFMASIASPIYNTAAPRGFFQGTELDGNINPIEYVNNKAPMIPIRLLSSKKINDLGWKPKRNLTEALKETIEWYKANKHQYNPDSRP
jgi:hypothetical protein